MRKIVIWVGLCLGVLGVAGFVMLDRYFVAPQNHSIGPLPADLVGETVCVPSTSGVTVCGWWVPGAWQGPSSCCMASTARV